MKYNVIDDENRIIKIECSIQDYLDGSLDKHIKVAIRMQPSVINVEIFSEYLEVY